MSIFGHKEKAKKEVTQAEPEKKKKDSEKIEVTEDITAAIGMSLYLYLNDRHDIESEVLTIKNIEHTYYPWNSKIYGINNLLK